jgi:hypothetical protein
MTFGVRMNIEYPARSDEGRKEGRKEEETKEGQIPRAHFKT